MVKVNDGADLVAALESNTYNSVFIPAGIYHVNTVVNIDHVQRITGDGPGNTNINIAIDGPYFSVEEDYCRISGIRLGGGGSTAGGQGALYITANYVSVRDCLSFGSVEDGFEYSSTADYVSFIDCRVNSAAEDGFQGNSSNISSRLVNCAAINCDNYGFRDCKNLSNCYVDGYNNTTTGFYNCKNISSSCVYNCSTYGFRGCSQVSACQVDGNSHTTNGFHTGYRLSSCLVENCTGTKYENCHVYCTNSCN